MSPPLTHIPSSFLDFCRVLRQPLCHLAPRVSCLASRFVLFIRVSRSIFLSLIALSVNCRIALFVISSCRVPRAMSVPAPTALWDVRFQDDPGLQGRVRGFYFASLRPAALLCGLNMSLTSIAPAIFPFALSSSSKGRIASLGWTRTSCA